MLMIFLKHVEYMKATNMCDGTSWIDRSDVVFLSTPPDATLANITLEQSSISLVLCHDMKGMRGEKI